ncbi:MAG: NUDIX hydrolase [Nitrospirae bacterium]|nr:NUDIX hydrolase [Nitrospirota bacterium]
MTKPAALKRQTSSGGVIYKKSGDDILVVLVSVRGGKFWCLPKGLLDRGETPEMTAVREVREESGLSGRIVEKLGDINYWYYVKGDNIKCRKTVHFYLMEYLSGDTADHDFEVDSAEWFTIDEAIGKISFKGDKGILLKARARLREIADK